MAITFRAAGTVVTATGASSITLTAPAGVVATDIVLAVIYGDDGTNQTVTPPSGWTVVNQTNDGTQTRDIHVYWALGSVASYVFSLNSGAPNGDVVGFTLGYIGVDTTTPMDATAVSQVNAANTVLTAPTITTVTANAWLVGLYGQNPSPPGSPTFSSEFGTHRQSGDNGGFTALDTCDLAQAVAGASGAETVTSSKSGISIGVLAALRPAAAGGATVSGAGYYLHKKRWSMVS